MANLRVCTSYRRLLISKVCSCTITDVPTTGDLSALLKPKDSTRVLEEFTLVLAAHSNFADCLVKAKVSSYKANGKGTGKRGTLKLSPHDIFKVNIILNSISASIETQHSRDTKPPPKLVKKRSKEDQELAPSNKKPKVVLQKTTEYQEMYYLE